MLGKIIFGIKFMIFFCILATGKLNPEAIPGKLIIIKIILIFLCFYRILKNARMFIGFGIFWFRFIRSTCYGSFIC